MVLSRTKEVAEELVKEHSGKSILVGDLEKMPKESLEAVLVQLQRSRQAAVFQVEKLGRGIKFAMTLNSVVDEPSEVDTGVLQMRHTSHTLEEQRNDLEKKVNKYETKTLDSLADVPKKRCNIVKRNEQKYISASLISRMH